MRTLATAALAAAFLSAGYAQDSTQAALSGTALIDHHIKAKWDEQGLKAAKRADDAEFMRRVNLDIVGVIPSLDEAEKFLADKSPTKRQKRVESLLQDPGYAEHWSDVWSGIIVGHDNDNRDQFARLKATEDIEAMLAKNLPHDEFARRIITVKGAFYERPGRAMTAAGKDGNPEETGLAGYVYNISREAGRDFPMALAGKLTRAFMGVQIQCAQCHDHPFDKWTQEEFYGMASFFTEVSARRQTISAAEMMDKKKDGKKEDKKDEKKADEKKAEADPKMTDEQKTAAARAELLKKLQQQQQQQDYYVVVEDRQRGRPGRAGAGGGDLTIPDSKTGPVKAAFIDSKKGAVAGEARRETFAKYMTEKENLQFARMAVNRMWAHFFGAGIVNPVDDFNGKNKATHPALLDELAKDFIAHKYDNHWLIKAVTASEAYNLTSRLAAKERDGQAEKFFALNRVRALSPEQILRSVLEATDFGQGAGPVAQRMGKGLGKANPAEMGGGERLMFGMLNQFRSNFGDDEGNEVVEFSGTIPAALLMMNNFLTSMGGGLGMQRPGADPRVRPGADARTRPGMGGGGALGALLQKRASPEDRVEAIFLSVLSRKPSSGEQARWKGCVTKATGTAGYEDLYWTLLNTSEFLFNH